MRNGIYSQAKTSITRSTSQLFRSASVITTLALLTACGGGGGGGSSSGDSANSSRIGTTSTAEYSNPALSEASLTGTWLMISTNVSSTAPLTLPGLSNASLESANGVAKLTFRIQHNSDSDVQISNCSNTLQGEQTAINNGQLGFAVFSEAAGLLTNINLTITDNNHMTGTLTASGTGTGQATVNMVKLSDSIDSNLGTLTVTQRDGDAMPANNALFAVNCFDFLHVPDATIRATQGPNELVTTGEILGGFFIATNNDSGELHTLNAQYLNADGVLRIGNSSNNVSVEILEESLVTPGQTFTVSAGETNSPFSIASGLRFTDHAIEGRFSGNSAQNNSSQVSIEMDIAY